MTDPSVSVQESECAPMLGDSLRCETHGAPIWFCVGRLSEELRWNRRVSSTPLSSKSDEEAFRAAWERTGFDRHSGSADSWHEDQQRRADYRAGWDDALAHARASEHRDTQPSSSDEVQCAKCPETRDAGIHERSSRHWRHDFVPERVASSVERSTNEGVDEVDEHEQWHTENYNAPCGDDCEYEPSHSPGPLTSKEASEVVAFARLESTSPRRLYATLLRYANLTRASRSTSLPIEKIAGEIVEWFADLIDDTVRHARCHGRRYNANMGIANVSAILRRHFTDEPAQENSNG